MGIKMAFFDMDGTLSNDLHRKPAYEAKDWDTYWNYDSMMSDPVWGAGRAEYLKYKAMGWKIGILTARLEDLNWDVTYNWLKDNDFEPDYVFLRSEAEKGMRPPEFKTNVISLYKNVLDYLDDFVLIDNDEAVIELGTQLFGAEHMLHADWELEENEPV